MRSRPRSRSRWLVPLLAVACGPVATPPSQAPATEPLPTPAAPASVAAPVRPTILSAHLARLDDPELDGKDGLVVVFDAEVDAASLQPRAFAVVLADEEPVLPEAATLAPASEDDENRTVLLVGELSAKGGAEPTHVVVVGPLWAEDGRSLRGLGAAVEPFAAGPRVVAAVVLAVGPGRCEGAGQRVRTYWSDELRGVDADDRSRVRIAGDGAAPRWPVRFDDHDAAHGEAGQDGVLDLCLDDSAPPRRLSIDAGAFHGPAGHPSAAVELALAVENGR